MTQLLLFPDIDMDVITEEVVSDYTKDEACYVAANLIEDFLLNELTPEQEELDHVREARLVVEVLRS